MECEIKNGLERNVCHPDNIRIEIYSNINKLRLEDAYCWDILCCYVAANINLL